MVAAFPPFQHPILDDWWYNKLATNRPQLFWDAHVRSVPFSSSLQRFITRLLDVDPSRRMTVEQMRQDEWFSGETLSAERLHAEMQGRRDDLNLRRMQERADAERQRRDVEERVLRVAVEDRAVESLEDGEDGGLQRGFGDALPTSQPSMALGTLDGASGGGEEARTMDFLHAVDQLTEAQPQPQPQSQAQPQPTFRARLSRKFVVLPSKRGSPQPPASPAAAVASPPVSSPTTKPAVAVYDPALTVPTLTLLPSPLPLSTLHSRLTALLSFHRFHVKYNETQRRYKASRQTPTGEVTLTVTVWRAKQDDADEDGYLLELRRHTGDSGQYRAMFSGLLMDLTERGIVASTHAPP